MFRNLFIIILFTGIQLLPGSHPGLLAQDTPKRNALLLSFENDMWNRTDWYFSNGINLGMYHEALRRSPVNYILFPSVKEGDQAYFSLGLRQEIYTPRDINQPGIQDGDHPYAATLSLVSEKTIQRPGLRLSSSLQLGVIGPAALGFGAQEFIHRITPSNLPEGWNNQVGNDLMLNYNLSYHRLLVSDEWSQFIFLGRARLGTVYTDATAGCRVRLEAGPKFFSFIEPDPARRFNLYVEMGGELRFVGYDASLQGGMLNRTSPYTIPGSDVERVVGNINISAVVEVQRHQLLLYQNIVSPRFESAGWHAWLGISYRYWW